MRKSQTLCNPLQVTGVTPGLFIVHEQPMDLRWSVANLS